MNNVSGNFTQTTDSWRCLHKNGAFATVKFLFFRKHIFICCDCWKVMPLKLYKTMLHEAMQQQLKSLEEK